MASKLDGAPPWSEVRAPRSDRTRRSAPAPWNAREECGNPKCAGNWFSFLKDRRRPVFEGSWYCGSQCLATSVDATIRREASDAGALEVEAQHHHRLPLGLILLSQGRITQLQLQRALGAQRRCGSGRIGDWLIEGCGLAEDHIMRALSVQWGCPVLSAEGFDPEAMALALPKFFVETLGIVPLRIAGRRILYLASAGGVDASAAFALERMNGLRAASGVLDSTQWRSAQQRLCACSFVDSTYENVADLQSMSRKITSTLAGMQPRASRLLRLHQFFWLRMWLETGAMRTRDGGFPRTREDVADRIYTVGAEQ